MKVSLFVEYENCQIDEHSLIAKAKELWLEKGNKIKEIQSLQLYVKPEEHTVYYVINQLEQGKLLTF